MIGAWTRWVNLVNRREPAHAVALVRVVFGLGVAAHMLRLWRTDTWRWVWLAPADGGLVPLARSYIDQVGGATPTTVEALVLAGVVAGLALAIGALTPLAALVTTICWALLTNVGVNAGGSYDFLGANVLFLLCFAGSGRALSVDSWVRTRRGLPARMVPAWPRWLMVWQLVVMYDMTVWQKLSAGWVPGGTADALWYILQQPTWQRFDMRWAAPLYPLTQVATLGTWVFEHLSPVLLLAAWFRHSRTRPGWLRAQCNRVDVRLPFLLFGVLLHVGIEATMEVGAFTVFTLGVYAACFSGDEVRKHTGGVPVHPL